MIEKHWTIMHYASIKRQNSSSELKARRHQKENKGIIFQCLIFN